MTFRPLALAAHQAAIKAAADRVTAARADAVAAARLAIVPALSDGTKVLLDPKVLRADWVSADNTRVVLTTPDALSFVVHAGAQVQVTWLDEGTWVDFGPTVKSAAEVGAYLASVA